MFTCKESIDLLQQYLDGDMPAEERRHLEAHLSGCTPCVDFVKSYQATPKLCRNALHKKMPEELGNRLMDFLRGRCKK